MKKKNLKLGKLTLTKSNVASLVQRERIVGGSGVGPGCNSDAECTVSCVQNTCTSVPDPNPDPQSNLPCHTQGFSCGPACYPTQENCVTQQTCGGNFLCDNQTFGGGF